MKRGTKDVSFFFDEDAGDPSPNTLLGVCLGWARAAEHEWGIESLEYLFGISPERSRKHLGLARCRISRLGENVFYAGEDFLVADASNLQFWNQEQGTSGPLSENQYSHALFLNEGSDFREQDDLVGAWDDGSFGLLVRQSNAEYMEYMALIKQAFQDLDIAIHIPGTRNPFANGGLCLSIYSRIPEKHLKVMREGDLDLLVLQETAAPRLEELQTALRSNHGQDLRLVYFSLKPAWEDETKTGIRYWLNPAQQALYRSGWFTYDQILEWAVTKGGPVCKSWIEARETEEVKQQEARRQEAVKQFLAQRQASCEDRADGKTPGDAE